MQGRQKRDGAIREQCDVRDAQILTQRTFKLVVKGAPIREDLAVPNPLQIRKECFERRQVGLCDVDRTGHDSPARRARGSRAMALLVNDLLQVLAIAILLEPLRRARQLVNRNKGHAEGNLFDARDLESLPVLQGLHERCCLQ